MESIELPRGVARDVHKNSTRFYFSNHDFRRLIHCMAEKKAGYRRGQKYIKNLRLYDVTKKGRPYWRCRPPDPNRTRLCERQVSPEPERHRPVAIRRSAPRN